MGRDKTNPMARRLRMLTALVEGTDHGSKSRMAKRLGIKFPRFSNMLNGENLTQPVIDAIVQEISGMSSDWLRYGHWDGLSSKMDRDLRKLDKTFEREDDAD